MNEVVEVVIRFVQFSATMLLFGWSLFPVYTGQRKAVPSRRIVAVLAGLVLASAVALLLFEAASMSGQSSAWNDPAIIRKVLASTTFGRVSRWRLLITTLLGIVLMLRRRMTDVETMLAASVWVGGLLPLLLMARRARHAAEPVEAFHTALRRFSIVGMVAVGSILATGVLNTWFLVGSLHALIHSDYGQVLCTKIALFLGMCGLAAINRFILLPRWSKAATPARLCLTIAVEQGLAVAVVLAVSWLGTMMPPFGMRM